MTLSTLKLQYRPNTKLKALEEADDIYDYSNQNEHKSTISHDAPLLKC